MIWKILNPSKKNMVVWKRKTNVLRQFSSCLEMEHAFKLFWLTEIMDFIYSESGKYAKYKYGDNVFSLTQERYTVW